MAGRTAIGIDIGGTRARGVLMADDGSILAREVRDTPAENVEATMETIYSMAKALQGEGEAAAVGIGAAGIVDFRAGAMRFAPNLAWKEVPIRDLVRERTGLPVLVDNDANVAAWGEYRFGSGRGYRHLLAVTVGTGIGGGIVDGGRLYRGAHGFAAEIGHIIVQPGGPLCGCGNRGCWEQVASGRALARMGQDVADFDPGSRIASLAGQGRVTGLVVAAAARERDPRAVEIFAEVGRRLGEGIAGLVNVLDPEAVVVGGGVAEEGDVLLEPARKAYGDAVEAPDHRPEVPILAASLGTEAGAIGAAALALHEAPNG